MSNIKVTSINFYKELSAAPVDWLLGNVGDKIRAEIEFTVSITKLASLTNPIILNATDGYLGAGWAVGTNDIFKDFNIGDTIKFGNYVANTLLQTFTIIDKVSDNEIQMSAAFSLFANDYESGQTFFSVANPITAIKYRWNFIEQSENDNYKSRFVETEQLLVIKSKLGSDTSVSDLEFIGEESYQYGNATIQGVSIVSATIYSTKYKIIHYLTIPPYLKYNEVLDFEGGIKPSDWNNLNCQKFIFDIAALYDYTNPNEGVIESFTARKGNTGFYDENFNTNKTNYYIDAVAYTNADGDVIDSIGLSTAETNITITVKNTVDNPFSNNNTKFVLGIFKVPTSQDEYYQNGNDLDKNFLYDRALQTVGSASVNGDKYGDTDRQILKTVVGTFVNSNTITITCKASMLQNVVDSFEASETPKYLLFVTVQNHTLATAVSDLVTLKVDLSEFSIITTDETMITINNRFLRHYEHDRDTEGIDPTIDIFPEDEVVAASRFYIDRTGREDDEIILTSVSGKVKAKNSVTNEEFELDGFTMQTESYPFVGDSQYMNVQVARQFHIPLASIRKYITLKRREDLDDTNKRWYEMNYPFKVRWEYWQKLAGVNSAFFDTSEPNNGFNHEWHRYTTLTNWKLYCEINVKATKNGEAQEYTLEEAMVSYDYSSNPDFITKHIKSYDPDDNTELFDGVSDRYITGFKNTLIKATFEKELPPINPVIVLYIEVYEKGGIYGSRRMSSNWESDSDTWFLSTVIVQKTQVTIDDNAAIGEALVDFSKIPTEAQFKISARIYETGGGLLTDDSIQLTTDDGVNITID